VVLVHGGGHGAWCWVRVLEHLDADARAVDLPPTAVRGGPDRFLDLPELRTLTVADFADAVIAEADAAGFARFVLVGHSLAGITIPEVAARVPDRVAHLVFLSCTVPAEGGSTLDRLHDDIAVMAREHLAASLARPPTGAPTPPALTDEMLRAMFGTDLDEGAMQLVLDRFGHEVMPVIDEKVSRAAMPPTIPKTWIRLLRDAVLSVADQDASIAYLEASPGGSVAVVDLDTGHDAMLSRPREVAAIVDGIAATAA
jgi:pimeloyl-ACP methyl ester carboxylesterase